MSEFENALDELDDRAKEGKTASRLIAAAEKTITEEQRLRERAESDREQTVALFDDMESALKDARAEIERLKQPRTEIEVDGPVTKYMFSPAGGTRLNDSRRVIGLWRLEEIESVLMHLRMAGAGGDLQVRITDGMVAACVARDDNDLPDGWSWKAPKPVIVRKIPGWAWIVGSGAVGVSFFLGIMATII